MKRVATAALLALTVTTAHASEAEDWMMFGRVLSVVQGFMQIALESPNDPKRVQEAVDAMLAGRNAEANRLMHEMFADMPDAERARLLSFVRTAVALGRRQAQAQIQARMGEDGAAIQRKGDDSAAIQARKDLAGMGLSYFDQRQFVDAVRRNDALAVRLYLAGRGVNPRATDEAGVTAIDIARKAGSAEMAQLLAPYAR